MKTYPGPSEAVVALVDLLREIEPDQLTVTLQRALAKLGDGAATRRLSSDEGTEFERLAMRTLHDVRSLVAIVWTNVHLAQELVEEILATADLHDVELESIVTLRETLADSMDAGRSLGEIAKDAMDLGHNLYSPASCHDLAEAVRLTVRLMNRSTPEVGDISVRDIPAVGVAASRTEVIQVTLNLLRNAREAITRPQPVIVLDGWASSDMAFVAVDDNGPGFGPGDITELLSPHVTTKRTGFGMGLDIIRTTVEHWGGQLVLEQSQELGGARVVFGIPRVPDIEDDPGRR